MSPLLIERVSSVHTSKPFSVVDPVVGRETLRTRSGRVKIQYLLCRVPLDCVDDITRSNAYNPRRMRELHRDDLMNQIGTYGLIQPLVATIDAFGKPGPAQRLYLIDGRHRYNGLLWLDPELEAKIQVKTESMVKSRKLGSISDPRTLEQPSVPVRNRLQEYAPPREKLPGSKKGAPMIPVKIYVGQDEVQRIGMAVFLNRGQKKLAAGEEITKVAAALDQAIEEELAAAAKASPKRQASEIRAVEKVARSSARGDVQFVVISRHVGEVMNDDTSPWYPVVGRYQNEMYTVRDKQRWKPLTAGNFHNFVSSLVDDKPLNPMDEPRREREIWNLNRLGGMFALAFDWPNDIPDDEHPYTATSTLCRSFLIRALGREMNQAFSRSDARRLLSESSIDEKRWAKIDGAIRAVQAALKAQAVLRGPFEALKERLEQIDPSELEERADLLIQIDQQRGALWSLDTVIPALTSRLAPIIQPFRGAV